MGDLYVLFDKVNSKVLEGPMQLPGKLLLLTTIELHELGWYMCLPIEYDVGDAFDENAYVRTSQQFVFTDTPYQAVRRLVGTQPRSLDEIRTFIIQRMTEFRNDLFDKGFTYGGYLFDADELARLNWTAAVTSLTTTGYMHGLAYNQLDTSVPIQEWTRRDNAEAKFKPSEIIACGLKLGVWASNCFKYCRAIKNQVLVEDDFETLWAIWTSNSVSLWPSSNLGGSLSLVQPS